MNGVTEEPLRMTRFGVCDHNCLVSEFQSFKTCIFSVSICEPLLTRLPDDAMRPAPRLQFLRPYTWKSAGAPNAAYLRFFHLARQQELEHANALKYPRLRHNGPPMRIPDFRHKYRQIPQGTVAEEEVTLHGRIQSVRRAGSKLVFFDLKGEFESVQGICNLGKLTDGTAVRGLKELARLLNRGDIICTCWDTPFLLLSAC